MLLTLSSEDSKHHKKYKIIQSSIPNIKYKEDTIMSCVIWLLKNKIHK